MAFISCSQVDSLDGTIQDVQTSTSDTRSISIDQELENSPLLNELRSFNDSLMTSTPDAETNAFWYQYLLKKTAYVSIVDMVGYVNGYETAKSKGLSEQYVQIIATIQSACASICAAISSIAPKLPPATNTTFIDYENLYSATTLDPNYAMLAVSQSKQLGDMSMFLKYKENFTPALNHNLLINKYRSGLSEDDNITVIFDKKAYDIIHSEEFQELLANGRNYILSNDIDYTYLFSDHVHMVTTISQYKAAEVMRLFTEIILNNNITLSQLKSITRTYMDKSHDSSEIDQSEKEILLNSFPITLMSGSLWTSLTNSDTE